LTLSHPVWTVPVEIITFLAEAPIIFFLLLFPDGRFAPGWTRFAVPVALAQSIFLIFLPPTVAETVSWLSGLSGLLFIGFLEMAVFSQIYRYRRLATVVARQQIKWAVFGIALTGFLLIGLSLFALIPGLYQSGSLAELALNTLYPLAALPIPLSIGVAILRYRLWDIDTLINRVLVYGLLTALLGALYAGLIVGLESLAALVTRQSSDPVALVISTLVIFALFTPVRSRLQRLIDRRFYREKYDAEKTLTAFSTTLQSEIDLGELREQLLVVVEDTIRPSHVSLWLRTSEAPPAQSPYSLEAYSQMSSKPDPA
jgi:hypothetical protein